MMANTDYLAFDHAPLTPAERRQRAEDAAWACIELERLVEQVEADDAAEAAQDRENAIFEEGWTAHDENCVECPYPHGSAEHGWFWSGHNTAADIAADALNARKEAA